MAKTGRNLDPKNKKLIHSHLVYGLPIWKFTKSGKLNALKVKQKKAIRKVTPMANLQTSISKNKTT